MHILRRMSKHLKAISLGSMALAAVGAIGWESGISGRAVP